MTLILGIESSCDETAASVVEDGLRIRSNVIASQHDLHERYGGVVPEIASRAHLERISPVIQEALGAAGVSLNNLDAISVGNRPGLIGSLLVGVNAAKAMAWAAGKPLIGVDHVRAHLYAGTMQADANATVNPAANETYPALGLVVSGGHSSLYELTSPLDMTLLGRTIDDAVGEAYDKAAVILDIGYPGGPKLDKLAQTGDGSDYDLPRSMLDKKSLDFSFSGLKTALLYTVRGKPQGRGRAARFERSADDLNDTQRANMAAAFQDAAIDVVMKKLNRAIDYLTDQARPPRSLLIGGGVSANSLLRSRAMALGVKRDIKVYLPPMSLCLDNAAMIAGLAHHCFINNQFDDLTLEARSTVSL